MTEKEAMMKSMSDPAKKTIPHADAVMNAPSITQDQRENIIKAVNMHDELIALAHACLETRTSMTMERKAEIRKMATEVIAKAEGK